MGQQVITCLAHPNFQSARPLRCRQWGTLLGSLPLEHSSDHSVLCCAKSLQSCTALCDPMDCSPPDSSVHGILWSRILEWVAIPSSRGSSQLRDGAHVLYLLHCQASSLPLAPPGTVRDCLYLGLPHDSTEMALFSSNSIGYAN